MKHRKFDYSNYELKKDVLSTKREKWNILVIKLFPELLKFIFANNRSISLNVILITEDSKMLICERKLSFKDTEIDNSIKDRTEYIFPEYILPGGHLDKRYDKDIYQAIARELHEECLIPTTAVHIFRDLAAYSSVKDLALNAHFHNFTLLGTTTLSSSEILNTFKPTHEVKKIHCITPNSTDPLYVDRVKIFTILRHRLLEYKLGVIV